MKFSKNRLMVFIIGVIVTGVVLVYGVQAILKHTSLSQTAGKSSASGWIISGSAIQTLQNAGASPELINRYFNNPTTFVILGKNMTDPLPNATHVQTFTSYADIVSAFNNGNVQSRAQAILYDNEGWSFTPKIEQQAPLHYAQLAGELVHNHGLKFINTPALDLVKAPNGDKYNAFVRAGILKAAKYTDVFEVQLQGTEMNSNYITFGRDASKRVRAINPKSLLFLGLSTNPGGKPVTAQDLHAAYQGTAHFVDGYWINIPQGGEYCPQCGTAQPHIAIDFYTMLFAQAAGGQN